MLTCGNPESPAMLVRRSSRALRSVTTSGLSLLVGGGPGVVGSIKNPSRPKTSASLARMLSRVAAFSSTSESRTVLAYSNLSLIPGPSSGRFASTQGPSSCQTSLDCRTLKASNHASYDPPPRWSKETSCGGGEEKTRESSSLFLAIAP